MQQPTSIESVFGTNLVDYVRRYRNPIPLVIVKCADAIDRSGMRKIYGILSLDPSSIPLINLDCHGC